MLDDHVSEREIASGDSPVTCGLCGHATSIAMIVRHLADEHGYDEEELAEAIAGAEIIDSTDPREAGA